MKYRFIILLALLFTGFDLTAGMLNPVGRLYVFPKNDFEKTAAAHPQAVYDKVFFGNSVLISGFIEEESVSGYVNFGIDYGKITDLKGMLEQNHIDVGGDIVIALNYFTFLDTLDTNPTYIWHKKPYEPYVYFQRDRLSVFLADIFNNLLSSNSTVIKKYNNLNKTVYYNPMTDDELNQKIETHSANFWGLPVSDFSDNLAALNWLTDYCAENGIRLRALWMPWNNYAPMPDIAWQVMNEADRIFGKKGVEVLDWTNRYDGDRAIFHDLGHLTYEYGAPVFTEDIDEWLVS